MRVIEKVSTDCFVFEVVRAGLVKTRGVNGITAQVNRISPSEIVTRIIPMRNVQTDPCACISGSGSRAVEVQPVAVGSEVGSEILLLTIDGLDVQRRAPARVQAISMRDPEVVIALSTVTHRIRAWSSGGEVEAQAIPGYRGMCVIDVRRGRVNDSRTNGTVAQYHVVDIYWCRPRTVNLRAGCWHHRS